MTIRTAIAAAALAAMLPIGAAAQTNTVKANRLTVGPGTPTPPTVGTVKLSGLGSSGGTLVVFKDASDNIIARVLARADLFSQLAYEDEANVFTQAQTISNTAPAFTLTETDAATDLKNTRFTADAGGFALQHLNDALSVVLSTPLASTAQGSVVLNPFSKQVLPGAPYEGTIGSPLQKWLAIYAAELNVETLVAQDTMATTGGRILVGPTTQLIEDLPIAGTTIRVKHNNLANGDRVYSEADGRVEFMAVTSGATAINRCSGNCSIEGGTGSYTTDGTVALAQSNSFRYRGGSALRWIWSSGTANVYRNTVGELAASTQFTASIYVRRGDGAAIVPSVSQYTMVIDSTGAAVVPTAVDVGEGWYRLVGTRTTGAGANMVVGISQIPTGMTHYFDAWQIELGASATAWSETASSYTVTRNIDGSGSNDWDAGTAVFNTGTTGNGFIDIYSRRGVRASTEVGPTIVGNVRQSSTYNDWAPRWAIGNLRGLYGYPATDLYGVAMGDATATYVTIEPTNGFRIIGGGATKVQIDASGNAMFASGNATIDQTSMRIAANTVNAYANGNGFTFTPSVNTGGNFGVAAHGLVGFRGVRLNNVFTGSALATLEIAAGNAGSATTSISLTDNTTGGGTSAGLINLSADEVRPISATNTRLGSSTNIWGSSYIRHMWLPENASPPASPASGTELSMRMCGDKFVITFNDGGTVRYKSFDLTGTNVTWAQATAAPAGC